MSETMQSECVTIGGTSNKNESSPLDGTIEDWKEVRGYEGLYAVSSLGRVKRISGALWKHRVIRTERILKSHWNGVRYPDVCLYNRNGKKKTFCVHQVVASAFLGENCCCPTCGNSLEINHKNGNKKDNRASNLEYVTRKKNMAHWLQSIRTT